MSNLEHLGYVMKDGTYATEGDSCLEPAKYGEYQELHPDIQSMEIDFTNAAQNEDCCAEELERFIEGFKAPDGQKWVVTGYLCTAICELEQDKGSLHTAVCELKEITK
jgi:hypothetical protein